MIFIYVRLYYLVSCSFTKYIFTSGLSKSVLIRNVISKKKFSKISCSFSKIERSFKNCQGLSYLVWNIFWFLDELAYRDLITEIHSSSFFERISLVPLVEHLLFMSIILILQIMLVILTILGKLDHDDFADDDNHNNQIDHAEYAEEAHHTDPSVCYSYCLCLPLCTNVRTFR